MSVASKKLAGRLVTSGTVPAAPSAPAAPPAPRVSTSAPTRFSQRSAGGGMAPSATVSAPSGGIGPSPTGQKPTPPRRPYQPPPKLPAQNGPQKAVAPAGPPGLITDSTYWANVQALNADYGSATAMAQADQTFADTAFDQEQRRMQTDFGRSKRNLAESLLGQGSAVYGGMHTRQRSEMAQDNFENQARLADDFNRANFDRSQARADIESALAPNVGTQWLQEAAALQERNTAQKIKQAETGAPVGGEVNLTRQIKQRNRRIQGFRQRLAGTSDKKKRKDLRARIQRIRRERDRLRDRRDQQKEGSK